MASDIMKQGYVKFQSKNIGLWKKRWLILRAQTKSGPVRLEKFEDECAALTRARCRTFVLTDVVNIYRVPDAERRHALHIDVDQYDSIQFGLESEAEAILWMKKIEGEIAEAHNSRNSFSVYLMKNPKVPIHGECTLELTGESIRLLNHRDQEVVMWPLKKLRRYAVERNLFKIEAGRSCPTGEGEFVFDTKEAQEIYDRVHDLAKTMAFERKMNDMKISSDNKTNEKIREHKSVQRESSDARGRKEPESIFVLSSEDSRERNRWNDYGNDSDEEFYTEIPHGGGRKR